MDKYDRMASIPPSIERKAWLARAAQRTLARVHRDPYCFKCDQLFGSHEALQQHWHAKHDERAK
jgi:hypothetical protein